MKKYQHYLLVSCILSLFLVGGIGADNAEAQHRRRPQQSPPQQLPQQPPTRPLNRPPTQPAARVQGGIGGSLNIPIEETNELLDISASLHGTFLYSMAPPIKFEGDLGYWFLQAADDEGEDLDDPSLLTITAGLRYYLNRNLHIDGGLGLYRFGDRERTVGGVTTRYDDQNELGIYGGIGFEQFPLDLTLRIHHSDYYVDDFWNISLGLRIFFSSSGFRRR